MVTQPKFITIKDYKVYPQEICNFYIFNHLFFFLVKWQKNSINKVYNLTKITKK